MSTDHAKDVQDYIDGVTSGSIVTGRLERLAVWRHLDDLQNAGQRGFYFDESKAIRTIKFGEVCCRHYEGEWAGQPFVLRPEQKFIIWNLDGWRQKRDKLRRFRQVQIEAGRKWGKSAFASFLSHKLSLYDWPREHGAQGYVAATKIDQAKIVWKCAAAMVEQSPALKSRAKVTRSRLEIEYPEYNSIFRPIASDSKTVDGFNPHFIIKDEEHAWKEQHRGLADTLASGFGARQQPITITITTYGDDDSMIWKENHDYAVRCLESAITGEIVDDSWFAMIFATDYRNEDSLPVPCARCRGASCPWCSGSGVLPIDDPFNESIWRKANPGIGEGPGFTPKMERMRESANVAKNRLDKQPEFFQKNLNIIVASKNKVITPEAWMSCKGTLSDLSSTQGHGGFDLSRTTDFSAIAAVFPFREVDDDDKPFVRYEAITKTWTCEERPKELQAPMFRDWIQSGELIESPGGAVDLMDIEKSILDWHGEHSIRTWAYDRKFAVQMSQRLDSVGLETFAFGQSHGFYTEALTELLKCINGYRMVNKIKVPLFKHNGNRCLAWQASNLIVNRKPSGEQMPDKTDPKNKIDAMVAVLMALSECLYHAGESLDGYYLENSLAIGGTIARASQ